MLPHKLSTHTRHHTHRPACPEKNSPKHFEHGHRRSKSCSVATSNLIRPGLISAAEFTGLENIRTIAQRRSGEPELPPHLPSSAGEDFLMVSTASNIYEPGYFHAGLGLIKNSIFDTAALIENAAAARQKLLEEEYVSRNERLIAILKTPCGASIAHNEYIVDLLLNHTQRSGEENRFDRAYISELVTVGENIAKALSNLDRTQAGAELTVAAGPETLVVESNIYTVRALCWYMMGVAASQDFARHVGRDFSTSEMTTSGSFIMKDPDNRIYNFLNHCASAVTRTSTHYSERLGHDDSFSFLGFIPTFGAQMAQRGIEDYRSLLPLPGGALLFDKLKPGADGKSELFVKFEAAGCPGFTDPQIKGGWLEAMGVAAAATARNLKHCVHYVDSQSQANAHQSPEILRQEHVHKGVLAPVFTEFNRLLAEFQKTGLFMKNSASDAKRNGISTMRKVVESMISAAEEHGLAALAEAARELLSKINEETERLGRFSDRFNIERRGAEVHVSLDPAEVRGAVEAPIPIRSGPVALDESEPTPAAHDAGMPDMRSQIADALSAKFTSISLWDTGTHLAASTASAKSAPSIQIVPPLYPTTGAGSSHSATPDDAEAPPQKAVRTRSRAAAKGLGEPARKAPEKAPAKNEAAAYLDWNAFKLDWSELFSPGQWWNRLAFWR